jgi:diphthamide synthase subunit DPH2
MPVTQTKNELLSIELSTLSSSELDKIISQAIVLRAKKQAKFAEKKEANLLVKINQGLNREQQLRFDELAKKLQSENITESERKDFLQLTNQIELLDAKRIKLIGDLAKIRKQTFDETLKELGIGQS